jgi:hypothetical protein
MKPHPKKHQIKNAIIIFLAMFRKGDKLRTVDIVRDTHRPVSKYIRDESITRYLRQLRQEGKVNYIVRVKADRIMEML